MEKLFKSSHNRLILAVVAAAFLIRVIGLVPGHPPDHPDEPMSYGSALEMIVHGDLNPRRFDYPAGVPLVHYLFFKALPLPIALSNVLLTHPKVLFAALQLGKEQFMSEYSVALFGKNGITFLYWSRLLTAILGTASVYLVYLIGKKLFSRSAGLVAAVFLAFNYRHVLSSHLALSDIPNGFFALLAFYSAVLLMEKNTWRRYLIAGCCVGLSVSMKYQVFALFPYLFAHVSWAIRKRSLREFFSLKFIFGSLGIPLTFTILNPYFFTNLEKALETTSIVSRRYGMGAQRFNYYPILYLYEWGITRLPSILILFGAAVSFLHRPRRALLVLSYVGPFLYVFLYYMTGGSYVRNFSTVIPLLMLFAAYPLGLLTEWFWKRTRLVALLFIALLLALIQYPSIRQIYQLDVSYSRPWVRDELTEWVLQAIPDKSAVLNDNVSVPTGIEKPIEIIQWGHEEGNSVTEFMDKGYDFAVLNTAWNQIYFFWFNLAERQLLSGKSIPYDDLWNSYRGMALSEYLRYTVAEFYKPWPAPENSYLVIKIPRKPFTLGVLQASHQQITEAKGWVSPESVATSGKVYTVEGVLKADREIQSNLRDGFLRIDFYGNTFGILQTSVSGRVHGPSQWTRLRVVATAPEGTGHLTVSFQQENSDIRYEIDHVLLFESDEVLTDAVPGTPYISPTIPKTALFPNSIY